MAQDLLPESRGTASGLIMGLGLSVGGLLVGVVGGLAQSYGLVNVLSWMLVLLVPALAIAMSLPGRLGRPEAGDPELVAEVGRTAAGG
jgi:FSR family fosmidomycin resistance protein-like MFS transporter